MTVRSAPPRPDPLHPRVAVACRRARRGRPGADRRRSCSSPGSSAPARPGASGSPRSGTRADGVAPRPRGPTFVRPTPSPQPSFITHVVQPGDTLSSIARKYDTTARSIAWWNRGAYPSSTRSPRRYDPNHLESAGCSCSCPDTDRRREQPADAEPRPRTRPRRRRRPRDAGPTPADRSRSRARALDPRARPADAEPNPQPHDASRTGDGDLARAANRPEHRADVRHGRTAGPGGPDRPVAHRSRGPRDPLPDRRVRQRRPRRGCRRCSSRRPARTCSTSANHSWDHPDFRDLTAAQMADQLTRYRGGAAPDLRHHEAVVPPAVRWLERRGPRGRRRGRLADDGDVGRRHDRLAARGATAAPPRPASSAKIQANARGGSIVLMHLGG